jgi:hypothetical protein
MVNRQYVTSMLTMDYQPWTMDRRLLYRQGELL